MAQTAKISISLPEEVFRAVEDHRKASRETRSDFFRRAAEWLLRKDEEREEVARYVRGYQEHPETEEDHGWGDLGEAHLGEAPWQ